LRYQTKIIKKSKIKKKKISMKKISFSYRSLEAKKKLFHVMVLKLNFTIETRRFFCDLKEDLKGGNCG